jgi:hypothetical protein
VTLPFLAHRQLAIGTLQKATFDEPQWRKQNEQLPKGGDRATVCCAKGDDFL